MGPAFMCLADWPIARGAYLAAQQAYKVFAVVVSFLPQSPPLASDYLINASALFQVPRRSHIGPRYPQRRGRCVCARGACRT